MRRSFRPSHTRRFPGLRFLLSVNCVFPPELGTQVLRRARVLTACRRQSSGSDSAPWPALRAPAGGRKRLLHPGGAQRRCRPRGWRRARSRAGEREPRGNTAPCAASPRQQKLCSEVPRGKKRGAGHVGFSSVLASRDAPPFRGAPAEGGIPFVSPRVRPELEPEQPGRRTVPKAPLQPRGAARRGRAACSAGSATRVPLGHSGPCPPRLQRSPWHDDPDHTAAPAPSNRQGTAEEASRRVGRALRTRSGACAPRALGRGRAPDAPDHARSLSARPVRGGCSRARGACGSGDRGVTQHRLRS